MAYRKLGVNMSRRRAMLRNIVTSLLKHGKIETTEARAKELNSLAEKMITLGKRGDLAARRQAMEFLLDETVVKELFDTIAPKYADRQGGYTRIMKNGYRRGDAAEMVLVELVD
ncbi:MULTISPECIES: 50S ribosomal protein L17 [Dehalobacter]|uniref:Large ribosomal subunit protein bL17 n=1 Tax=Dehalobacter restrictus (strain DSM 9455 / PER-K23) TaxID=871738 RepID=A0ABM5P3N0_DEHRP|nr:MULTISPECIES: 50S ribosomal protein L17 [Dehalobacter]AHF09131.1 50S ribosomal protein L17 [Dehalobacter restrictus DSM 9455]MCM1564848.1 50S ribosomal protein L17 [Dehalobacter sp.]MDJ0306871.1 50S ribosomal protein L17 [Dehalobacter sp.]